MKSEKWDFPSQVLSDLRQKKIGRKDKETRNLKKGVTESEDQGQLWVKGQAIIKNKYKRVKGGRAVKS